MSASIISLRDRFPKNNDAAPASTGQHPEEMFRAFGYMIQFYRQFVMAGLYSDYSMGVTDQLVHMVMRPTGADQSAEQRWMSFEQDPLTRRWTFCYRGLSLSHASLDTLAQQAHARIQTLENRELPCLMLQAGAARLQALLA